MKLVLKLIDSGYEHYYEGFYSFECESKEVAQVELYLLWEEYIKKSAKWRSEQENARLLLKNGRHEEYLAWSEAEPKLVFMDMNWKLFYYLIMTIRKNI